MKTLLETEEYESRTVAPSIQKLEEECKKITRDSYWKKTDQYAITHKLNSQKSKLKQLKWQINGWNNALEEQQNLHQTYKEQDTLKIQLQSLHHKLRHKSSNLSSERAILRDFTQLQKEKDIAKDKATKKVENQLYTEELVQSNINYIRAAIDRTTKQFMVKQQRTNRLNRKEDMLNKRVEFLKRKLAKNYIKIEAKSYGSM